MLNGISVNSGTPTHSAMQAAVRTGAMPVTSSLLNTRTYRGCIEDEEFMRITWVR